MADTKISALTTLVAGDIQHTSDVVAIVDTSVTTTKKATAQAVVNAVLAQNTDTTVTGTINQTTIPTSKTLLVSTDIGSTVQGYDATTLKSADIGVTVQGYDAQLADVAGLAVTDGNFIVGNGTNFVAESGATARTSLGLGTGDSPEFTAVNIGSATDTTITRSSAGVIAVEGSNVLMASNIGTTVQGYDADTAKLDVAQTFTAAQTFNNPTVFSAGTASLPSITFTGDTNTGIFSPAADTIAFAEGGAEAMRIDSSGRVGIGTTSPATLLNVSSSTTNTGRIRVTGTGSTTGNYRGYEFASGSGFSGGLFQDEGTGALSFWSNSNAESMRIDSSGNVGIGTTSPNQKLDVNGASVVRGTLTARQTSALAFDYVSASNLARIISYGPNTSTAGVISFVTESSDGSVGGERARITSGGELLVGTTTTDYATAGIVLNAGSLGRIQSTASGTYGGIFRRNTSTGILVYFNYAGTDVGTISTNGSNCTFNSISDYRLKENIVPMSGALSVVSRLKPCTYTWKIDGSTGQGFVAHELAEVLPDCVTGEKDAVKEDGSINPQMIDTSVLVATLTAAIQELKAIVDAQAVEIAALKGTA